VSTMIVGSIRTSVNPPLTNGIYEALLEKAERERDEARKLAQWFYTRLKQVCLDHPLEGNVVGILARLEEAVLDDPWLEAAK